MLSRTSRRVCSRTARPGLRRAAPSLPSSVSTWSRAWSRRVLAAAELPAGCRRGCAAPHSSASASTRLRRPRRPRRAWFRRDASIGRPLGIDHPHLPDAAVDRAVDAAVDPPVDAGRDLVVVALEHLVAVLDHHPGDQGGARQPDPENSTCHYPSLLKLYHAYNTANARCKGASRPTLKARHNLRLRPDPCADIRRCSTIPGRSRRTTGR